MTKIIMLNGRIGCGKDTFADYICARKMNVKHFKFTTLLVQHVLTKYKIPVSSWESWYVTGSKDIPRKELCMQSPRQALISTSLELKDKYGNDYFGRFLANTLYAFSMNLPKKSSPPTIIISDTGFNQEVGSLLEVFEPEDLWLVRIIGKDGISEEMNGGREWITHEGIIDDHYITIQNDGTTAYYDVISDTYDYIMSK